MSLFYIFSLVLLTYQNKMDLLHDHGLFFVNVNENNEIQLYEMDLKSEEFVEKCNFGKDYTDAYKGFKDYENLRSGDGIIMMDDNQYIIFLHNDVDNRQSGDILKCQLDTNKVTKVGSYDFSCEHLFGGNGANFAICASTMNETVGTAFYSIEGNDATNTANIPYSAIPGEGNTCYWDRTFDQSWCYLFKKDEKKTKYWLDTDLGTQYHHTYIDYIRNITHLYSIDRLDCNTMFAVIEYERDSIPFKAVVELKMDYTTQDMFDWSQTGLQETVNKAKDISTNVITSCEYDHIVFLKVFDTEAQLLRLEWKSGQDKIVDTSKIGDLKYMSQMVCL